MIPAVLHEGDALALELRADDPLAALQGDPRASIHELYSDGVVQSGVWEVTPGRFQGENAGFTEHMHVLTGSATVTSDDGTTVELRPGVTFVARDGWRGEWDVHETLRKLYVIWTP